jgi:DNA-binding MarR family transcriptional regulator
MEFEMDREWQRGLEFRTPTAAASLPPAMVEETGWDILLALHFDERCELGLKKLASLISVPPKVMHRWLAKLEEHDLISAAEQESAGELRAELTRAGREMLDNYLSATSSLVARAHH